MTPRQTAKKNGDKIYNIYCAICNEETEHYVSSYSCRPCVLSPERLAKKRRILSKALQIARTIRTSKWKHHMKQKLRIQQQIHGPDSGT